ncbi:MAG: PIN domain-containing protein [Planctomycetes bacterium]|nr:PIN domain-containing protein [Planctomycetota bacterium]
MKVLLDTSVLVAALVESHPMHPRALPWLQRAKAKEFELAVSSHTLVELYAVLSALPVQPRIAPGTAWRMIHENLESVAEIVSLSAKDYSRTIKRLADSGLTGGLVYDALIAAAAKKSSAGRLVTLNLADFRRSWPEGADILCEP